LNSLPPFSGIEMLQLIPKKFLWPANLLGYVEGDDILLPKKLLISLKPHPKITFIATNIHRRDQTAILMPMALKQFS